MEVLQKKFEDFLKDLQANESRITYINDLADQLAEEGHPDIELITTKQKVLNYSSYQSKTIYQHVSRVIEQC